MHKDITVVKFKVPITPKRFFGPKKITLSKIPQKYFHLFETSIFWGIFKVGKNRLLLKHYQVKKISNWVWVEHDS